MRRWHQDEQLMRNRINDVRLYYHLDDDVPWRASDRFFEWRNTLLNPGKWRKRKPLDCGRAKCGSCHGDKFYGPKARNTKRLKAIQFELEAEGD